ncbi:DNA/RNA-binding protein kin17 [Anaeramoeba ignava]|uniref:DNA/RNA-binding protein kin17 n=1 Tax=Anaeramoeba ignava TaxID=1746090 RepID=A0A9Q0R5M9_ANAIG|nr:DNA/RNA-binding protein kin17 [Anaeramoeba ignava]
MSKHKELTPKQISKQIKAKGLQKLKFYCEMCQKQCRDANGFKCHCNSEGHRRMMSLASENPDKIIAENSRIFEKTFMSLLKTRFRNRKVLANHVYMEHIRDRRHTHMNSTRWTTLTGFIRYLGKTGKIKVEDEKDGLYIMYVNTDSEESKKLEKNKRKIENDLNDEERNLKLIKKRISQEKELEKQGLNKPQFLKQKKKEKISKFDGKIKLNIKKKKKAIQNEPLAKNKTEKKENNQEKEKQEEELRSKKTAKETNEFSEEKQVKFDEKELDPNDRELLNLLTMDDQEEQKEDREKEQEDVYEDDEQPWILENIIVRIKNNDVQNGEFYNKTGIIQNVIEKYIAEISVIENKAIIQIDQAELEPILPKLGELVLFIHGIQKGQKGKLISLGRENAKVEQENGIVLNVHKNQICKFAG